MEQAARAIPLAAPGRTAVLAAPRDPAPIPCEVSTVEKEARNKTGDCSYQNLTATREAQKVVERNFVHEFVLNSASAAKNNQYSPPLAYHNYSASLVANNVCKATTSGGDVNIVQHNGGGHKTGGTHRTDVSFNDSKSVIPIPYTKKRGTTTLPTKLGDEYRSPVQILIDNGHFGPSNPSKGHRTQARIAKRRSKRVDWTFLQNNITAWDSAGTNLLSSTKADVICIQEHKCLDGRLPGVQALGWRYVASSADLTVAGGRSSGVAVLASAHLPLAEVPGSTSIFDGLPDAESYRSRFVAALV